MSPLHEEKNKQVVVVVPVYKKEPSHNEILSLKQCLKVLGSYPIALVCPENMDLSFYLKLFEDFHVLVKKEIFPAYYFQNISGYNRLMLSADFYKRFVSYEYLLIYQLDAYVFRDELDFWCKRGYDYAGAPFMLNGDNHIDPSSSMFFVGNGGFSLRKVNSFLRILKMKGKIFSVSIIAKLNSNSPKWKIFLLGLMSTLGYRNTINYFILNYGHNEDVFYSACTYEISIDFKGITFPEAVNFSIESDPSLLIGKYNGGKLPFGCHAWEKNELETFWFKYITDEK